jgi:hypothetical protein
MSFASRRPGGRRSDRGVRHATLLTQRNEALRATPLAVRHWRGYQSGMSTEAGKKSGRARSANDGEEVRARIERSLLVKLDAWIAEQPQPHPSRSEAVRRILAQALAPVGSESIPIEELNASNDE